MVRSDTKSAIALRYLCVPISSLDPENALILVIGVEWRVDASFASASCLDRQRKSKSNIGQDIR